MNLSLSSGGVKWGAEFGNAFEVKESCFDDVFYVTVKWEGGINNDTQVFNFRGSGGEEAGDG